MKRKMVAVLLSGILAASSLTLKDGYKYYIVNDGYASVEEVIARGIDEDKRNLSMEIAGVCPVASVNGSDFTFSKINYAEEVWNDDKSVEATAQMSTTTLDNALVWFLLYSDD